jgi:hypothetical protein
MGWTTFPNGQGYWVCVRRWTIFFFSKSIVHDNSTKFLSFENCVEFWGFTQVLRDWLTARTIKSMCCNTNVDVKKKNKEN